MRKFTPSFWKTLENTLSSTQKRSEEFENSNSTAKSGNLTDLRRIREGDTIRSITANAQEMTKSMTSPLQRIKEELEAIDAQRRILDRKQYELVKRRDRLKDQTKLTVVPKH